MNSNYIVNQLEQIRHQLIDIGKRNKLISFRRNKNSIIVVDEQPNQVFDFLVNQGKSMQFKGLPEIRYDNLDDDEIPKRKDILIKEAATKARISIDETLPTYVPNTTVRRHRDKFLQTKLFQDDLESRLRIITSNSRSLIEETGQNQLFIAIGFLEWAETIDRSKFYQAPLILLPVELKRGNIDPRTRRYTYDVNYVGEDLIHNISLYEKLKNDFSVQLPSFDEKKVLDFDSTDPILNPEKYFNAVKKITSHFNHWSVQRKMVLGFFSFSKLLMYLDLDHKRWPEDNPLENHSIIKELIEGRELESGNLHFEESESNIVKDDIPLVMDADSSQLSAINECIEGKNLVIEGPPGTGKSQTITNIIASYLNQGKSVLFISEKMAALDVVYRNLERVGLGNFCLEVHSYKARKRKILDALDQRIKLRTHDPIQLENNLTKLKNLKEDLNEYASLIKSSSGLDGLSVYDLFGKVEKYRYKINDFPISKLNIDISPNLKNIDIEERTNILRDLSTFIDNFKGSSNDQPWYGYNCINLFIGDENKVHQSLTNLHDSLDTIFELFEQIVSDICLPLDFESINIDNIESFLDICSSTLPNQLHPKLIINSIDNTELLSELEKFLKIFAIYRESLQISSKFIKKDFLDNTDILKEINAKKKLIQSFNLHSNQVNINQISKLSNLLKGSIESLDEIIELANYFNSKELPKSKNIDEFNNVIEIIKILNNKPDIQENNDAVSLLIDGIDYELFKTIRKESDSIKKQRSSLISLFPLNELPNLNEIKKINQILQRHKDKFLKWIRSSEYRKARKEAKSLFLEDINKKKINFISELKKLERYLIREEKYKLNIEQKKLLGPLFKGINSDWDHIEKLIQFFNELSQLTKTKEITHKIYQTYIEEDKYLQATSSIEKLEKNIYSIMDITPNYIVENSFLYLEQLEILKDNISSLSELTSYLDNKLNLISIDDNFTISQILEGLEHAIEKNDLVKQINDFTDLNDSIGVIYDGINTDYETLAKNIEFAKEIIQLNLPLSKNNDQSSYNTNIPDESITITDIDKSISTIHSNTNNISHSIEEISTYGEFNQNTILGNEIKLLPKTELNGRINFLLENIGFLLSWAEYSRQVSKANEKQLGPLVKLVEHNEIDGKDIVNVFLYLVYSEISKNIIKNNNILSNFNFITHERKIKDFSKLDNDIKKLFQDNIAYNASRAEIPPGISSRTSKAPERTELGLLNHEINKQRRHIPIRQLFERAGNCIKALKPIFMMSPMSVAQFLKPGEQTFDVVVMDEASQIKPYEAYGAIARGKQVVVVGDSKQLPPTTFFDKLFINDDYEDSEDISDTASILDHCKAVNFTTRMLMWHYRSEHEKLIEFSNWKWYDNRLIVFPSPNTTEFRLGLRFNYVDNAKYSSGKNETEAYMIAKQIIEHAKNFSEYSLGVGTFGIEQKNLIEDFLDKFIKKDPAIDKLILKLNEAHDGTEPLFIKNLENIQGDERDIIFISCTYGPDKQTGKVYQRFGPINSDNGHRRLNVMFTRAKKRMEIFSSMRPEDIIVSPQSKPGVVALKEFLQYAKTGDIPEIGHFTDREPDSDFELYVGKFLSDNGFNIEYQVGVAGYYIDLAIIHPDREGEYILGIECDGATYHSSLYARDRDRLKEEVLRRRGWDIHRIWSTHWFKNNEAESERLLKKIKFKLNEYNLSIRVKEYSDMKEIDKEELIKTDSFSDFDLKKLLLKWAEKNIEDYDPSKKNGIINDNFLDTMIKMRPTNMGEFRQRIPIDFRENLNPSDREYLDEFLSIIETHT